MITVSVDGIAQVSLGLSRIAQELPDAAARILNYVGRDVRHALQADIPRRFDQPTPYTIKGVRSTTATRSKLYTEVGFKGEDGLRKHYLAPHVFGGERAVKRFEWRLRMKGILPPGMYVVPGAAAKRDRYGNWSRGEMNQVLSALQAQGDTYANTDLNRTKGTRRGLRPMQRKRRVYWVGRPGNGRLPLGIWAVGERMKLDSGGFRKDRIRPVALFVRRPAYRERWDFFGIAKKAAEESVPKQLQVLLGALLKRAAQAS